MLTNVGLIFLLGCLLNRLDMTPLELQASSDPVYNGVNFDRTAEGEQVMISLASTIVVGVVAKVR